MSEHRDRAAGELVAALTAAFDTVAQRLERLEAKVFGDDGPGDPGGSDPGPDSPRDGSGPLFDPAPTLETFQAIGSELDEIRDHLEDLYRKMKVEVEEPA